MKYNKYISLSVIGIAGLIFAGCSSKSSTAGVKQTANVMEATQVSTLDQSMITQIGDSEVANNTQEGLYRLKTGTKVTPGIAKSIAKPTKNGTVYTFHLRSNAKWSNGDKVTAQDFVYGWRRTVTPKTKSPEAYLYTPVKNAAAIEAGKMSPSKLGVKAINETTLQVTLNSATPYFKYLCAFNPFFPQNQKAVEKYGSAYGTASDKMVYDGPFTMKNWTSSKNSWTMSKNKNYWDNKNVKMTKVNFQVEKDPQTALSLYQSKKLDNITLSGQQAAQEKKADGYLSYPAGQTDFLALNYKNKYLQNANIRKAISLTINRKALVNNVLKNGSKAPLGYVSEEVAKNPKTGKDFAQDTDAGLGVKYNLKQAKAYWAKGLKQLGVKKISLRYLSFDMETNKETAEYVQAAAEKLPGLSVKVNLLPSTQAVTKMQSHKGFDIAGMDWVMDYPDLSNWMQLFNTGNAFNMGSYSSKTYDKYFKLADTTDAMNEQKRYEDYQQAEETLMSDQGIIPLDQAEKVRLNNPKLKGITYAASSGMSLKNAYMTK